MPQEPSKCPGNSSRTSPRRHSPDSARAGAAMSLKGIALPSFQCQEFLRVRCASPAEVWSQALVTGPATYPTSREVGNVPAVTGRHGQGGEPRSGNAPPAKTRGRGNGVPSPPPATPSGLCGRFLWMLPDVSVRIHPVRAHPLRKGKLRQDSARGLSPLGSCASEDAGSPCPVPGRGRD